MFIQVRGQHCQEIPFTAKFYPKRCR